MRSLWQPHPLLLKLMHFYLSLLIWTAHVLQGESSTGAHQALGGVAEACRAHGTVSHLALPVFCCESNPFSTIYALSLLQGLEGIPVSRNMSSVMCI